MAGLTHQLAAESTKDVSGTDDEFEVIVAPCVQVRVTLPRTGETVAV